MVGEGGQPSVLGPDRAPIGSEVELPVRMSETIKKMRGLERRATIQPTLFREIRDPGEPTDLECSVDDLERGHCETRVACAEPLGEPANYLVVRAAFGVRR